MQYRKVIRLGMTTMALLMIIAGSSAGAGELRGRVVGDDAGAAIVWIEGLDGGTVPDTDTVLTHLPGGAFQSSVGIGFVGHDYVLRNLDDTMHNIHLFLRLGYQKAISDRPLHYGATLYNIALPGGQEKEVRRPIKPYHRYRDETGFIEVICNRHPEEKAYIMVFDHPYAAVTGEDGTFTIPNVPPGTHQVRIWQGGAVKDWKRIEVHDGAPTEVAIEM